MLETMKSKPEEFSGESLLEMSVIQVRHLEQHGEEQWVLPAAMLGRQEGLAGDVREAEHDDSKQPHLVLVPRVSTSSRACSRPPPASKYPAMKVSFPSPPLTSPHLILQWTTRVRVSLSGKTIRLCPPCCPSNWYFFLTFTDISFLTRQDSIPITTQELWTGQRLTDLSDRNHQTEHVWQIWLWRKRSRAVTRVQPS